jgi:hypothetical protein
MYKSNSHVGASQPGVKLLDDGYRAMVATGAADADREVGSILFFVAG